MEQICTHPPIKATVRERASPVAGVALPRRSVAPAPGAPVPPPAFGGGSRGRAKFIPYEGVTVTVKNLEREKIRGNCGCPGCGVTHWCAPGVTCTIIRKVK